MYQYQLRSSVLSTLASALTLLLLISYIKRPSMLSNLQNEDKYSGEPRQDQWWMPLHETFVQESSSIRYDVILYGDSITEAWRGTSTGVTNPGYLENLRVFQNTFQKKYDKIAAFGLAGDQSKHILWRLQHGELNPALPPTLAVLLIGTNDLGWARISAQGEGEEEAISSAVPLITRNMLLIIKKIHIVAPTTKIVLIGVLPRGGGQTLNQPSIYTPAIQEINMHYKEFASQDQRIEYVDCTDNFLTHDRKAIDKTKMPDGLHPSHHPGAQSLADCITPVIDKML